MARASSVVSARAMALAPITQHRNGTKVADFCSAPVAGFYTAIDSCAGLFQFLAKRAAGLQRSLACGDMTFPQMRQASRSLLTVRGG